MISSFIGENWSVIATLVAVSFHPCNVFGSIGADCIVIGSSGAISSKLYSIGVSNLLDFLFLGKESLDPIGLPCFRRGLDVLAIAFPESPIWISICVGALTAGICDVSTLFESVKASGN